MSREHVYSHQHRSRSRSFSSYRYNSSRVTRVAPSPPKFRKRSESPKEIERYRRSQSPVQRNGSTRNGHHNRSPQQTPERRRRRSESRPEPSSVIGVFGLHVRTSESEIRDVFERFGQIDKLHMVYDAKSRGFRGYCFVYYSKVRDATAALNETNGMELKERRIRVDYSKTKRAHTPTPGVYRGKRGQRNRSFERSRPPRRDFDSRPLDRYRRDDPPRYRSRSRDRSERSQRDFHRDREARPRVERRRSPERMERVRPRSPPPPPRFSRRDRS